MKYALILSVLLLGSTYAPAFGQSSEAPIGKPSTAPELVAPYDKQLLRLSEVLGSIHYLRNLCGGNEGNKWRDRMGQLIVTEEPGPKRRAKLIASFNRGYRSFNNTYATCTDSALLATDRYMKEGVLLSSQITGRYGR